MKITFSIRDLLWLMVVFGLLISWFSNQRVMTKQLNDQRLWIQNLQTQHSVQWTIEKQNVDTIVTNSVSKRINVMKPGEIIRINEFPAAP